jgi:putative sterol carrier protein
LNYKFPSDEWLAEFKKAINESEAYKEAASSWEAGEIALVVNARPDIGLDEDVVIWLDLYRGVCRDAKIVSMEEAEEAPFVIRGDYSRWKQVILKQLDPIKGMMQGLLKLKGDLPTIIEYVRAAEELVNCCSRVPTEFLDE